jgi:hypothetical protein
MKNVGYWQLQANPGVWTLSIAKESKGAEIFELIEGEVKNGRIVATNEEASAARTLVMKDFVNKGELLIVRRRPGFESASLFHEKQDSSIPDSEEEVINVFSLATGHLYERFLKIMMLSVTKRTSSKVKFWLFENFLSPTFKSSARAMAERIGCELEFVTYKWPEWLRGQSEKQRIIWGYKILFLDVLFPLNVKKIIYVDADQGKLGQHSKYDPRRYLIRSFLSCNFIFSCKRRPKRTLGYGSEGRCLRIHTFLHFQRRDAGLSILERRVLEKSLARQALSHLSFIRGRPRPISPVSGGRSTPFDLPTAFG